MYSPPVEPNRNMNRAQAACQFTVREGGIVHIPSEQGSAYVIGFKGHDVAANFRKPCMLSLSNHLP